MPDSPTSKPTGYDEFIGIFAKYKKLSTLSLGTAAAVPFVAYLSGIAPPWPPGVVLITSLVELLALIVVFQFLRSAPRRVANRVIVVAMSFLLLSSVCYLVLFAFFTYPIRATQARGIKGFVCQHGLLTSFLEACPFLQIEHLKEVGYDAEVLWQSWSIDLMSLLIVLTWMAAFIFLSILVGAFIVFQGRVRAR